MATLYAVGKSSYGELAGLIQYVLSAVAAAHVNALIAKSRGVFANGAVLSVNEAIRSRARQRYLRSKWEAYKRGGPWAALAAVLYLSTHDETRGNAIDFGVTMPDGKNRALTQSEHAWLVREGRAHGVIWTGGDPTFMRPAELWHFNVYPERATAPASLDRTPIDTAPPESEEDDMFKPAFVRNTKTGQVAFLFPDRVKVTSTETDIYRMGRAYGLLKPGENKAQYMDVVNHLAPDEYDAAVTEINANRTTTRTELVKAVWAFMVGGYNGDQSAGARLAGIDEKAGR